MPVVLRAAAFRVSILLPPREHGSAHVHVWNSDGLVVIYLATDDAQQYVERIEGNVKRSDVRKAERVVRDNTEELHTRWRQIHGE